MTGTDASRAAGLLAEAERIVILTGAGVSAESGVPTFRGADGLWQARRPEELATPEAFRRDPRLVWEWYQWRRDLIGQCQPNPAHEALARLRFSRPKAVLVTQNVDGLHRLAERAAGVHRPAFELHGSIFEVRCSVCSWRAESRDPVDASSVETLPRCPQCSELARPAVVWFGEALDEGVLGAAFEAARRADVCLTVGTSAVVHPAASVPLITHEAGGQVIEVNPEATALSDVADVCVRSPAGESLPSIVTQALGV